MKNPKRDPRVAWTEIDGEVVAISAETSVLHQMNPTGSFIWQQLTGEHSVQALSEKMASEFDVPLDRASADLINFLTRLETDQLLDMSEVEP